MINNRSIARHSHYVGNHQAGGVKGARTLQERFLGHGVVPGGLAGAACCGPLEEAVKVGVALVPATAGVYILLTHMGLPRVPHEDVAVLQRVTQQEGRRVQAAAHALLGDGEAQQEFAGGAAGGFRVLALPDPLLRLQREGRHPLRGGRSGVSMH